MKRLIALVVALSFAVLPATASAQAPDEGDDFTMRVSGDVIVAEGESIESVIVIDGDLTVAGEITGFALVIDGDAIVSGRVDGDLSVISGDVTLGSSAVVGDVNSIRGDVIRDAGSTVTGKIHERDSLDILTWASGVFSLLVWSGMTVAMVVAGLLFATFGRRQLEAASRAMTGDVVNTVIGGVLLWVAVPVVAALAMVTIVGLPLGLGICLFVLPAFGLLGYLVAGARFGSWLLQVGGRNADAGSLLAAGLGVFALQLLVLLPVLGAAIALLAGLWGSSALAFQLYHNVGGSGFEPSEPSVPQGVGGLA